MFDEPTDVVAAHLAGEGVAFRIIEQVLAVLPQALVDVHTGTVIGEQGLGHEGGHLAVLTGHVLNDVFVDHDLVGHISEGVILHIELPLAGGSHLVVMHLHGDAAVDHGEHHLAADVLEGIVWRHGEVAFLVAGLIA